MREQELEFIWPHCAVCEKRVEKLKWLDNFANNTKVVIAYCHGERDSCELTKDFLIFNKLLPGYAFVTQALKEREKEIRALLPSTKKLMELAYAELAKGNTKMEDSRQTIQDQSDRLSS